MAAVHLGLLSKEGNETPKPRIVQLHLLVTVRTFEHVKRPMGRIDCQAFWNQRETSITGGRRMRLGPGLG